MKRITLSLFILFLGLQPLLQAETYDFMKEDGFSIELGTTWGQIPNELLTKMRNRLQIRAKDMPLPKYKYGFQLKHAPAFDLPYIYIFINRKGKIPYRDLKRIEKSDFGYEVKKMREKYSMITGDLQLDKMVYDKKNKTIWVKGYSTVPVIGPVHMQSGTVLTSYGSIQISCYSRTDQFHLWEPVFKKIIESVKIDPEQVYYSRLVERIPILNQMNLELLSRYSWIGYILGPLIIFLTLIRWYYRVYDPEKTLKKQKKTVQNEENKSA